MFGSNEYTGLVLDDEVIKIARIKAEKGKIRLVKVDSYSLAEPIERRAREEPVFEDTAEEGESDSVFGFEEADDLSGFEMEEEEEINLDDLEAEEPGEEDLLSLDMAEEADTPQSNEILLYNIISAINGKKIRMGLNISAGNTIFQIIRDTNFNEVKQKDLVADLEEKLESIYGVPKTSDNYAYEVRENGSLVLASIEDEAPLLGLVERTKDLYSGKLFIEDVLPDEAILVGLVRTNYDLIENQITGILQFGPRKCRIVFLKGKEIWLVSPIINEGTKNKGFLNTVFSKILFQLDTGEVPNLDRLILANNSLGDEAVDFFRKNFPDIFVEEFNFDPDKFDYESQDPGAASAFTTAIGLAWAVSGHDTKEFPELSLVPGYIKDRQKIFKLQWHGVLLLLLIFLTPLAFNYLYQQNVQQIQTLEADLERTNSQIQEITPTVNSANQLSNDLALLREKLVLLDTLSRGSQEWSAKLDILNNGLANIPGIWLTSLGAQQDGSIMIDGYSTVRARIPELVNVFSDATLLNVTIEEVREREIYSFVITIRGFTRDRSRYSPPRPEDLRTILGR